MIRKCDLVDCSARFKARNRLHRFCCRQHKRLAHNRRRRKAAALPVPQPGERLCAWLPCPAEIPPGRRRFCCSTHASYAYQHQAYKEVTAS